MLMDPRPSHFNSNCCQSNWTKKGVAIQNNDSNFRNGSSLSMLKTKFSFSSFIESLQSSSSSSSMMQSHWLTATTILPSFFHRLLLLQLDKQIGGTIYCPFLAMNKAHGLEGVEYLILEGAVHMPCWMQNSTSRWLCSCVSSFNNRRLWFFLAILP